MNRLHRHLHTGTLGELLVQIRFLEYGVQAAPPHKDTGNDLIAVRHEAFRAVQVKAKLANAGKIKFPYKKTMGREFHLLALVFLEVNEAGLELDRSRIYLLPKEAAHKGSYWETELEEYRMSADYVRDLFPG